jgi:outer membrane protein
VNPFLQHRQLKKSTSMRHKRLVCYAGISLVLGLPSSAFSQQAGTWSLRGGWLQVAPSVNSGNLTPSALPEFQADVLKNTRFGGGINYTLNDHWAVDVPVAVPFRHDIMGAGSASGFGKLGDVRSIPVTVLAQYRLGSPQTTLRPYVGVGLVYARFDQVNPSTTLLSLTGPNTTVSVASRWGTAWQAGADWTLTPHSHWFVHSSVSKILVSTQANLSTDQTLSLHLDPWSFCIGLGYRF